MTAEEQTATETAPKLRKFLADKSVRKVLFIDDGFDLLELMEPTVEEQDDLWATIEADDRAFDAASAQGLSGADDLSGEIISKLREHPDGDPLRRLAEASSYVVNHESKVQEIRFVIDYLKSLGLQVDTCGQDDWQNRLSDVNIVFLDWKLGQEADTHAAITRAVNAAKGIHKDRRRDRPMIVLISSDPSVQDHARKFSQESGLISGLFDAMPKGCLQDRTSIDLQMTLLSAHLEKGHIVQNFVDAVSNRTQEAAAAFVSKIRNLTLSDYANLQHFALRNEGHPLGDYLTELLAGVWIDELFQGPIREPLRALDKEDFESLPALMNPSDVVNELYNAAIFDTHIDDFQPHPHADEPQPGQKARLALSLGDIVVEREVETGSKVYMVINPQCDLAESPRHKRRPIDDDLSVLLLPGTLRPVGAPERTERKETADTPYFATDGAKGRIQWDAKKQIAVPYSEFAEWLAEKQRARKARMRTTFALALQTAVHSELTRVGLPVPPPMYQEVEATIRHASMGTWTGDSAPVKLGQLLMTRDSRSDQVVLTREHLIEIWGIVRIGVGKLAKSENPKDRANAAKIEEALADPAEIQRFARPFPVSDGGEKFFCQAVYVCRKSREPKSGFNRSYIACLILPD